MMFVILPVLEYIAVLGTVGNAGMYGMILMALVIMYCVIFNDKSPVTTGGDIGLSIIFKASREVQYTPTFGANNLIIRM